MKSQHLFIPHVIALVALLAAVSATAGDWPQWRGPHRNGISPETGLLRAWPADGPKLRWQATRLGNGYSTPAVVGDRLYLISNEGLDNEFVQALSTQEGRRLWSTRLGKVGNPDQKPNYPAARSTPTVDGEVLYALGSDGDLACLETATGKVRWRKQLRTDFGGQPGIWAYSESPLVDGDALICTPGGAQATLLALHKQTGAVLWKCALPGGDQASYASPIITEIGGVKQYVQFLHHGLAGVNAQTGALLWRFDKTADRKSGGNIPTPVAAEGYVYSAAGLVGGALARVTASNGAFAAEQVYFSKKLPNAVGGFVLVDGHLYGTCGPTLQCVEFTTGTVKWDERSAAPGSVCYADGRLYLHGENGELALVEATPAGYREQGRFTPSNPPDRGRSKAWAYPVIAQGRLYVHDWGTLWCYEIKAP